MEKPLVLIAEREPACRQSLREMMTRRQFGVIESSDEKGALRLVAEHHPALAIIGSFQSGDWDGLELAQEIRRHDRTLPLILLAQQSSEALAIAALREGINDYLKQPLTDDELDLAVNRCLSCLNWVQSAAAPVTTLDLIESQRMIGESPLMRDIKAWIAKLAATDSTVLITGETGTGKELVAELIHRNCSRRQKPFVCINCAAIPDSLVESELFGYERGAFTGAHASRDGTLKHAEGGTVFFDEIGDMSPYAQAKILRVIESKEVHKLGGRGSIPIDIRIIAATNRDLEALAAEGKFRQDLYYRLNVGRIHLPPLRKRKEDIPSLLRDCIHRLNGQFGQHVEGFTDEALECLLHHDWPGNVREVRNVMETVFITHSARFISRRDLPEHFRSQLSSAASSKTSERDLLLSTLFSTSWNKSKAAARLNWSRMTLYRKMAKYRIVNVSNGGVSVTDE
jgi:DNA-binding NtrC family response regulator